MSEGAPTRGRGADAVWLRAVLWGAGGVLVAAAGLGFGLTVGVTPAS